MKINIILINIKYDILLCIMIQFIEDVIKYNGTITEEIHNVQILLKLRVLKKNN